MKRRSMLLYLLVFLSTLSFKGYAQDSLQVLFLGNSLTYSHDIPGLIQKLALSNSDKLNYSEHLPGGWTLYYHHLSSPVSTGLIRSKNWDYVVLQGQSREFLYENEYVTYNGIRRLVTMMRENCSRPAFYSTAAPRTLYKELQTYIHLQYAHIANEVDGLIIPVGNAFEIATDNGIVVYSDKVHPNLAGSYLAACTFYAALYRKSPIGLSFQAGLSPSEALALQTIADQVVMGNFKDLNIYPIDTLCANKVDMPDWGAVEPRSYELYPNPSLDGFSIRLGEIPEQQAEVSIYNMQGGEVFRKSFTVNQDGGDYQLNPGLPAGIYTFSLRTTEYVYPAQKLIIQ